MSWCVRLSVRLGASVRACVRVGACVWALGVGCGVRGMEWNGGWVRYCSTMTEGAAAAVGEGAKAKGEPAGFALEEAESWPYSNLQQNMEPLGTGRDTPS